MRVKPGNHITIEIRPYSAAKIGRNKRGLTHLLRVYEREPEYATADAETSIHRQGISSDKGKLVSIFEQEIQDEGDNAGIARALRRFGSWFGPDRKRKPPKSKLAKNVRKAAEFISSHREA